MAYPSTISSFTNPAPTDKLNSPSHSGVETAQNTGLTEIMAFVGTISSTAGTLIYDIRSSNSDGGGHVQAVNKGGTGYTSYTKGDVLVASSASVLAKLAVGTDGAALLADSTQAAGVKWGNVALGKFGGTGADGALTITSGTTTVNLASVLVATKNYTTISITGTGVLAFTSSNSKGTVVILKSQGAVTLTSSATPMIDLRSVGATGGGATAAGNAANSFLTEVPAGVAGSNRSGTNGGAGGTAGTPAIYLVTIARKAYIVSCGAGGSGGGNGISAGGAGGAGGGVLIIECAAGFNFTTSSGISVNGTNGSNGAATSESGGGGGGGGAGGQCIIAYSSLIAASGTITIAGGTGGNGGNGQASAGTGAGGGGAGGGNRAAGGAGGAGGNQSGAGTIGSDGGNTGGTAGSGGTSSGGNGGGGGGGGGGSGGDSLVTQNTEFI